MPDREGHIVSEAQLRFDRGRVHCRIGWRDCKVRVRQNQLIHPPRQAERAASCRITAQLLHTQSRVLLSIHFQAGDHAERQTNLVCVDIREREWRVEMNSSASVV